MKEEETEEKKEDKEEESKDKVETIEEDTIKPEKPKALHKTTSIFLRNLAPTITRQEVEAICSRWVFINRNLKLFHLINCGCILCNSHKF